MNRARMMAILERAKDILVPTVVETTHRGERHWSIFDRLLRDRIVFLGQEIDDVVANLVIAQLLFLEGEDPDFQRHITAIADKEARSPKIEPSTRAA